MVLTISFIPQFSGMYCVMDVRVSVSWLICSQCSIQCGKDVRVFNLYLFISSHFSLPYDAQPIAVPEEQSL